MSLVKSIAKAMSTASSEGGDFLPQPLALDYIKWVRDANFMRQLFKTTNMTTKTKDYPKVLGSTKVYYQATEGGSAQQTDFSTGTLRLEAKKLMAEVRVSEEVIEDAQGDFVAIVRENIAAAQAEAEEEAMVLGDPSHSLTDSDESNVTGNGVSDTWYTKDCKLTWYGLLTLAGDVAGDISQDTRASNRVYAATADMSSVMIRQALHNLGKFGRVFKNTVAILNPWSVNQLLDDSKLVTVDKYGPKATIITGEFGALYGQVKIINSSFMTSGYGVVTHTSNPIIGDRRLVKVKSEDLISTDQKKYVITSRADFAVNHQGALCQIYALDTPSELS